MERECDRQSHGGVAASVHLFVVTKVELSAEGIAKLFISNFDSMHSSRIGACNFIVNSALDVIAVDKHRIG